MADPHIDVVDDASWLARVGADVVAGVETGDLAQVPRWVREFVEVDQPLVGPVTELVAQRASPTMCHYAVDDRGQRRQGVGRRVVECRHGLGVGHHETPRRRAASTPERQPSSWKPQPW